MVRLATVLAVFTLVSSAPAADIAFDSAGDSAYNNGWLNSSNGGYGWGGGWSLTSYSVQPTVGDSTAYGFPDINSPQVVGGRAWQLQFALATRPFSGPLSVGQTFSIDWVDDADGWQFISAVSLLAPNGSVAVEVGENQSGHYIVGPAGGPFADTGIAGKPGAHLAITQTSTALQFSLTQYAPGTGTAVIDVPYSGQVSAVQIGTDVNPNFINNLSITPEPSSIAVLGLAVYGLLVRRRGRLGSTGAVAGQLLRS